MIASSDAMTILASASRRAAPIFSICIPQYNRSSFLLEACKSLVTQRFPFFELCISDDRSTDGREDELISFLRASELDFTYARQKANRRYDGNLRGAIALARGEFVFLLGNDDRLAGPRTLENVHEQLRQAAPVHVAITNYREIGTGRAFQRVSRSGKLGSGPSAAVHAFRNFSFVSGIIFDAECAKRWSTWKWDGSEMYQMYLGCRILAAGGTLLGISEVCIEKDIQITGESVDSYASVRIAKRDFSPVVLPMSKISPLVIDAVAPYVSRSSLENTATRIGAQLLLFTYAFWIIELRRVQSWKYAVSVYRGLGPKRILEGLRIAWPKRSLIAFLYAIVGLGGLTMPVGLFRRLQPLLYRLAKRSNPAWT
jgi:glycosyltransferase involved in cell wall biosynthesis